MPVIALAFAGWGGASAAAAATGPAAPVRLDPPAAKGALAFRLAPGREGTALLSWLEPVAADRHRLRVSRLRGGRWTEPATVAEGEGFFANWADTPAVAEAASGGLVATWLEKLGAGTYAYGIAWASSSDGGGTWKRGGWLHADRSPTEHGFVALAPTGGGVRAIWLDGARTHDGGAMALRTALVEGGRVSGERELDDRVCDCCSTAAVDAAAGVVVAYRDRSAQEVRDIALRLVAPSGEARPVPLAADRWTIPGCPVNGPALAARGRIVALAWFTGEGERPRVRAALSSDGGASFSTPVLVDGERPWGRVDVALDGGGAVVSWLGGGEERAPVRLARLSARGAGRPLTVATTAAARASGMPRLIALGDRFLVAWREEPGARLRVTAVPAAALAPAP